MRHLLVPALFLLILPGLSCTNTNVNTSNTDPEAAILEPAPEYVAPVGEMVTFRGTVDDGRTDPELLEVTWSSSLDGLLWEGFSDALGETTFSDDELSLGEHTITLRVIDPQGASGTDAISITIDEAQVENTTPICAITAPADDAELTAGETVVLEGTADDAESVPTELTATWSSSEDGDLGQVTPSSSGALALPVDDLSVGTHVITLDVSDGELNCSEFIVVEVIPDNFPPSVDAPTLTPDPLFTDDLATCSVPTPSDPEGDPVTVVLRWLVDGNDVGVTADTLAGATFDKGQTVQCEATPSDATGTGDPSLSALVTVSDTPPTQPTVSISPASPVEAVDDLVCTASAPSTDADGDTVTYSVTWTFGGTPYLGAVSTTTLPGDTIPGTQTQAGTYECTVTPEAAGVQGLAGTDAVTVGPPGPVGKLVFVTSTRQNGALGGVTGADSVCQTRANAAGLSGTFKAWISGGSYSSSPASRFTRSTTLPYVRVDGAVVANDWNDLTDGTIQNPINIDEFGNLQTYSFAWSFTRVDGSEGLFGSSSEDCYGGDCHCNNWTITATQGSPTPGSAVSQLNQTNDDWTDYSFGNFCGSQYGLKCFEQ